MLYLLVATPIILQASEPKKSLTFIDSKFYSKLGPYYKKRWPNAVNDPFEAADLITNSKLIENTDEYNSSGAREKTYRAIFSLANSGNKKAIYYMFSRVPNIIYRKGEELKEIRMKWGKMAFDQNDVMIKYEYIVFKSEFDKIINLNDVDKQFAPLLYQLAKRRDERATAFFARGGWQLLEKSPIMDFNARVKGALEWAQKLMTINTPAANEELARLCQLSIIRDEARLNFLNHAAKAGEWQAMVGLAEYYGNKNGDHQKGWYWLDQAVKATGLEGVVDRFFGESDPWPRQQKKSHR